MDIKVKFRGRDLVWLRNPDGSGPLALPEHLRPDGSVLADALMSDSYAHVFPDGVVRRYLEEIATVEELCDMGALQAKPGFDWQRVRWDGPEEPQSNECSYCGRSITDDPEDPDYTVPLRMWTKEGAAAVFCDPCAEAGFGVYSLPPDKNEREPDEPCLP